MCNQNTSVQSRAQDVHEQSLVFKRKPLICSLFVIVMKYLFVARLRLKIKVFKRVRMTTKLRRFLLIANDPFLSEGMAQMVHGTINWHLS